MQFKSLWAVSGTPTGDNIIDGLVNMSQLLIGNDSIAAAIKAIQAQLKKEKKQQGVELSSDRMKAVAIEVVKLFNGAIWRVTHDMMAAELNIPPQTLAKCEVYHSSYEEHLYSEAKARMTEQVDAADADNKAIVNQTGDTLLRKAANRELYMKKAYI
jgi:SNF2-related domain